MSISEIQTEINRLQKILQNVQGRNATILKVKIKELQNELEYLIK
jgi:hypothetical protein